MYKRLNSTLIQRAPGRLLNGRVYYIGLDVHKKTISYCLKKRRRTDSATRDDSSNPCRTG
jgi:hypothetical protein